VRDDLMTFVCQLDGQHLLEGDVPAAADDDG
jgi:hypothetical protein